MNKKLILAVITIILMIGSVSIAFANSKNNSVVSTEKIEKESETEVIQNSKKKEVVSKNTETISDTQESSQNEKVENTDSQNEGKSDDFKGQSTDAEGEVTSSNCKTDAYAGRLSVSGNHLVDQSGNTIQLRGLSTHGISWFGQYINADFFQQLKEEFHCNVVRLAMYTAEYGGYCSGGNKEELEQLIDNGVTYASNQDMYVIIDWHILSDNNPNQHKDEARDFFDRMTKKYADNEHVLYEICNEPNGGTTWNDIKSYANEVIPVIRANAPSSIVIVGTPNWSQFVNQAAADPITGYDNIMYALHFYAATHKADLRTTMKNALDGGLPIFVTEFGICDASGNGGIDESQASEWMQLLDEYHVSFAMWNISNKNETSAIISPSCNKTSGFGEDDLSDSGKWFLRMMNGQIESKEETVSTNSSKEEASSWTQESNTVSSASNVEVEADASAKISNSWESDGKKYYQYEITVSNTSNQDCTSWHASVDLGKNVEISQSWCGDFSMSGSVLNIKPVDYNGAIAAGQSIGNIGLIVME